MSKTQPPVGFSTGKEPRPSLPPHTFSHLPVLPPIFLRSISLYLHVYHFCLGLFNCLCVCVFLRVREFATAQNLLIGAQIIRLNIIFALLIAHTTLSTAHFDFTRA